MKTMFEVVKECIDRWDPYCLLRQGCPEDEFDIESRMVCERINVDSSFEEINAVISDVFSRQFGPKYFQPNWCIDVSKDLYEQINKIKEK